MSVNPVDDRNVDLIFDGLVDGLVHQAFPLDDLLVLRANGVVPVDVEVRGDDAVVGAVHDKGRLAKGWSVKGVVHLCDAHLLDHAEAHVLVVEGILLVVLDDGRVGANAVRQRVLELDEGLGGGRGQVDGLGMAHRLGQQDAVKAGELIHRQELADRGCGVLLGVGEVVCGDLLRPFGVAAPWVDGNATTVAHDAGNGSRVLSAVGLDGETTHGVPEEEHLFAGVFLVGDLHELVHVVDEVAPIVDVATWDGVVDVWARATTMPAVIEAVG